MNRYPSVMKNANMSAYLAICMSLGSTGNIVPMSFSRLSGSPTMLGIAPSIPSALVTRLSSPLPMLAPSCGSPAFPTCPDNLLRFPVMLLICCSVWLMLLVMLLPP